jgi:hypothetical protein
MKAKSSGLQDDSAVICALACWYLGATVVTDPTNGGVKDVKLVIWDSPTSTLTGDVEVDYFQATDEKLNECHIKEEPLWCSKGIFAKLDAKEGDYIVWYAL